MLNFIKFILDEINYIKFFLIYSILLITIIVLTTFLIPYTSHYELWMFSVCILGFCVLVPWLLLPWVIIKLKKRNSYKIGDFIRELEDRKYEEEILTFVYRYLQEKRPEKDYHVLPEDLLVQYFIERKEIDAMMANLTDIYDIKYEKPSRNITLIDRVKDLTEFIKK